MTQLEIIFTIFVWVVLGIWISFKRNWYRGYSSEDRRVAYFFNILLAPALIISSFMDVYVIRPWLRYKDDE